MSDLCSSHKYFVKLLCQDFVSVSHCIFTNDGGNLFSSQIEAKVTWRDKLIYLTSPKQDKLYFL